ncbi:MAG: hypothetical protein IJD52_01055 [Alphaproteobacteria bacterium]|nr:hypothetical protein [Alphaproteobacteria bacterium]
MQTTTNKNFSDATKILKIICNILDKEAIFQNGHWSSAVNFERWLKEDGFTPACPISYQYKFPDGISEADYEKKIMNNMYYLAYFRPLRIEDPARYIDTMYKHIPDATDAEKQQHLDSLNNITGELSPTEKQKIIAYFTDPKNVAQARISIKNMVREIKQLNPILADIPVTSLEDADDLLIGVTSRFHPEDIKYFITTKKTSGGIEQIRQDQKLFLTALDYTPNLFVAPSRIKQIVNGIILQKQSTNTRE